ncbi:hypothetical protein B0H11DRAFT_2069982 [Mycena galericulata]|nr:hypothetical protein B0H11DRAFT_2069982 [Mycena galericulata]
MNTVKHTHYSVATPPRLGLFPQTDFGFAYAYWLNSSMIEALVGLLGHQLIFIAHAEDQSSVIFARTLFFLSLDAGLACLFPRPILFSFFLCRRPFFKFHLACMVVLFTLSTAHITIMYTLAFLSNFGVSALYEIFSLRAQAPTLFPDGDPHDHLNGMAQSTRILYGLSNAVADALIIYRCYVVWASKWTVIVLPVLAWSATLLVSVFGAAGRGERAVIIAAETSLFTNIMAATLAAGLKWWIGHQAKALLGKEVQIRYRTSFAILLESGLLYPVVLPLAVVFFIAPVGSVGTLTFWRWPIKWLVSHRP